VLATAGGVAHVENHEIIRCLSAFGCWANDQIVDPMTSASAISIVQVIMREAEQAVAAFEAVEVSVGCPDRRPSASPLSMASLYRAYRCWMAM
jgi:hypothetical protein